MDFTIVELSPTELSGSRVVDYIYLALADMIRKGPYPSGLILHLSDKSVLVAMQNDQILGILAYSDYAKYDQSYHINLSYTSEDHRRKGVNTALWAHLVKLAQDANILTITSGILENNTASISNAKKRGMELYTLQYSYSLRNNKL